MTQDVNRMVEDARKAGVDMSWLLGAYTRGMRPASQVPAPGGITEGAADLFTAAGEVQAAARDMYHPRPPGTPTFAALEAERAAEQWEKQWDYGLERQAIEDEWRQKEWDYGVKRDQIADQMARASLAARTTGTGTAPGAAPGAAPGGMPFGFGDPWFHTGGTGGEREAMGLGTIADLVDEDIAMGTSFSQVIANIDDLTPFIIYQGVDPAAVLKYAVDRYGQVYDKIIADVPSPAREQDLYSRSWQQQRYNEYLKQRDSVLERLGVFEEPELITREEAEYYAGLNTAKVHGITADDIMEAGRVSPQALDYMIKRAMGR